MSIRGTRSSRHHAASEATQDLQLMEGQLHGVANIIITTKIIYTHARSHVTYTYVCVYNGKLHGKLHVRQNG